MWKKQSTYEVEHIYKAIFKNHGIESAPRYYGVLSDEIIDPDTKNSYGLVHIPSSKYTKFARSLSAPFLLVKDTVPTLTDGLTCVEKHKLLCFPQEERNESASTPWSNRCHQFKVDGRAYRERWRCVLRGRHCEVVHCLGEMIMIIDKIITIW